MAGGDGVNAAIAAAVRRLPTSGVAPAGAVRRPSRRRRTGRPAAADRAGGDATDRTSSTSTSTSARRAPCSTSIRWPPSGTVPHLVVMGLGQFGRNVVITAAQHHAAIGDGAVADHAGRSAGGGPLPRAAACSIPRSSRPSMRPCLDLDLGAPTAERGRRVRIAPAAATTVTRRRGIRGRVAGLVEWALRAPPHHRSEHDDRDPHRVRRRARGAHRRGGRRATHVPRALSCSRSSRRRARST